MNTNPSVIAVLIKIAAFGVDLHSTNYVDCKENPKRVASNIYTLTTEMLNMVLKLESNGKLSAEEQSTISDANQFLISVADELPKDIGVALGMAIVMDLPNPFEAANDNTVY